MIDITLENFQAELIEASLHTPVLLDIWAPWCAPCKALGPVLEKLERELTGRFVLAKLNSDEEPEIAGQLSQAFGVRSIPFCVMFLGGQPVDGFVGALPESQIREFLAKHLPPGDGAALDDEADAPGPAEADAPDREAPGQALDRLAEAVAGRPDDDGLRADWVQALLEAGQLQAAEAALAPLRPKLAFDARAAALALWLEALQVAPGLDPAALEAAIAANRRDFDARHRLAQWLWAAGRPTEAMDALLEILMRDKAWQEERARKAYVAILALMATPQAAAAAPAASGSGLELAGRSTVAPSDPVRDQYRRKLSMALF